MWYVNQDNGEDIDNDDNYGNDEIQNDIENVDNDRDNDENGNDSNDIKNDSKH